MHTMRRRQKRASGDSRMEIMESNLRSHYSRKFIKSICKKILNKTTFVKDDILTFACSTVEFSYNGITDRFNLLLFVLELVNLKIYMYKKYENPMSALPALEIQNQSNEDF